MCIFLADLKKNLIIDYNGEGQDENAMLKTVAQSTLIEGVVWGACSQPMARDNDYTTQLTF